jgi:hypothetical protein
MINRCVSCHQPFLEGEKVTVNVTSTYHILKSTIAYALDKYDMEADSSTLRHEECGEYI